MTNILVTNIETFETITTFDSMDAFDAWMDDNAEYGIVSLDTDADGEYGWVALVAPLDGPDFMMDTVTGEMEPVVNQRAIQKAAIVEAIDSIEAAKMNDVPQEQILAMLNNEATPSADDSDDDTTIITKPAKQKKSRKSKVKSNTQSKAKGAKMSTQTKSIRNFEILCAFIEANPGVSRTDVFADSGLQSSLRTPAQIKAIAAGDKLEVKRWNRRLNFLIRESGRQGVDIQIERKGRVAHYTITPASGQLELPFDDAAAARNAAITGDDVANVEVEVEAPAVDVRRADEPENVSLNFEDLLATLDADEATITSDDQIAFENAKEMLK